MVRVVPGGEIDLQDPRSHNGSRGPGSPTTWIDQHEVTNDEYKRFVDAGGYEKREFWKQPFVKDGRTISWEEAVASSATRRAAPAPRPGRWASFPKGLEKHPVAGVSWYEAAAYAEFAGKSLPVDLSLERSRSVGCLPRSIVPGSNFRGPGTVPVGGPGP